MSVGQGKAAAERKRRERERKRLGLVVLRVVTHEAVVQKLVERGELSKGASEKEIAAVVSLHFADWVDALSNEII